MERVLHVNASCDGARVRTDMALPDVAGCVLDRKQIVVLKNVFSEDMLIPLRQAVRAWGKEIAPADVDDFRGNYHRRRAMVSRLQQAPHVFHDYNFNLMNALQPDLAASLLRLFEPLGALYHGLTGIQTTFEVPDSGPYVHPQLIHYPSGGGFFGRHWHNLMPQTLGFIVSLSKRGRDYRNGGTCFEIDGEIVNLENHVDIGDICVWRYDLHHWVTQSDLQDKFDWDSESGRWVATYAYFDPYQ